MKKKSIKEYAPTDIEPKWRNYWVKNTTYSPNLREAKNPFVNLMMFPYPSAEGLHVGSMYAFGGADVYGRFKRMSGYDVFEPIGLDGFGIHSENFAIKVGRHPKENAEITEKNFYRQLSEIGNSFAWDYRLQTYDPNYYKWTQWLFVELFKAGLAYKGVAKVNWCPSCKTVLADEQVEDGLCERCSTQVTRREMSSWYFRITDYADQLLQNIDGDPSTNAQDDKRIDSNQSSVSSMASDIRQYDVKRYGLKWPEKIKIAQRNWIGKKAGINISYQIKGQSAKDKVNSITCFTTRPDTNFGATFIVVSPEYAQSIIRIIPAEFQNEAVKYIKKSLSKSEQQRLEDGKIKTGVFTGLYAINNLNDYEMPIYIADFVLSGVGTGAVVGVPGHDVRDFEFAQEFDLPVVRVVETADNDISEITSIDQVQESEGVMINSDFLNGLDIHEATDKMMDHLEEKGWGERVFNYHLRDWLISRQRYWGPPIPMIYCKVCAKAGKSWFTENSTKGIKGNKAHDTSDTPDTHNTLHDDWSSEGWYPDEDLPVELPDIKDFKPKGDGTSPLSNAPDSWKFTKCPECGNEAERELDVSDTFLDSSWYFLAYPNLKTKEWSSSPSRFSSPFNKEITEKWMPVSAYIGGAEHAVLHLLYARFTTMVLKDLGYISFEEPFPFLFGHGLIIKDGAKMSKSKGNVINPDDYISKFGADALRCYLMFLGPYDSGGDFRDTGMEGMSRFMNRVWNLVVSGSLTPAMTDKDIAALIHLRHKTIEKVTGDMVQFKFNTSLAAIMEYVNFMREFVRSGTKGDMPNDVHKSEWAESLTALVKLLAPFAPHMTEELWIEHFGYKESIHLSNWPEYDKDQVVEELIVIPVQINGKLRTTIETKYEEANVKNIIIAKAKADENVAKYLTNKKIIKEIFVPGKLLNFVVAS